MKKTNKWMDFFKEYGLITAGTLLLTIGVYFFKYPNNFSTGGVTGIAVVLNGIFPGLTRGTIVTVINVFLLIVGYFIVGKEFGIKTVYSSLLMTLSVGKDFSHECSLYLRAGSGAVICYFSPCSGKLIAFLHRGKYRWHRYRGYDH